MKIDGLDWMDWLHKIRRESEEERKRLGLSRVEWLRRMEREADQVRAVLSDRGLRGPLAAHAQPVARDKPANKP